MDVSERLKMTASAGAELLDEQYPGWFWKVDTGTLMMETTKCCVLGQLYGDYHAGIFELELERTSDHTKYGFRLDDTVMPQEYHKTWLALDEAWESEINKRRAA